MNENCDCAVCVDDRRLKRTRWSLLRSFAKNLLAFIGGLWVLATVYFVFFYND